MPESDGTTAYQVAAGTEYWSLQFVNGPPSEPDLGQAADSTVQRFGGRGSGFPTLKKRRGPRLAHTSEEESATTCWVLGAGRPFLTPTELNMA